MAIPVHASRNFQTLLRAAQNGDLALVECLDPVTREVRYVICAVGREADMFALTPFGHLASGNRFEEYIPPELAGIHPHRQNPLSRGKTLDL